MECVLCNSITNFFKSANKRDYYKCPSCMAVQLNSFIYVSEQQEINLYKTHNNDVFDKGYQNFVSPIFNSVINDFNNSTTGLDFGCGTGPVITKLLRDQNYTMVTYDPFFDNNENALKERFKNKFEKLSDKEIENKLSQKLVPEAIQALNEIQTERK